MVDTNPIDPSIHSSPPPIHVGAKNLGAPPTTPRRMYEGTIVLYRTEKKGGGKAKANPATYNTPT